MMHQPLAVESQICKVDLFRDKALVTRRAQVPRADSQRILRLGGLPLQLEDDSVRVRAIGPAALRVLDLSVEWDLAAPDAELLTVQDKRLRQLLHEQTEIKLALRRSQIFCEVIESLRPSSFHATDLPEQLAFQQRRPLEAWLKFTEFCREALQHQRKEIRQLQRKLHDLGDLIELAQDQRQRQSEAERAALALCRKAVVLRTAVVDQPGELELELSYLIGEARWYPQYELRVQQEDNQAELVVRALVAQRTGEDWPRSSFVFSTADLARSAALPELDSWRIGRAQPRRATGWRSLPENLEELFQSFDAGVQPQSVPMIPSAAYLPGMPPLELGTAPPLVLGNALDTLSDQRILGFSAEHDDTSRTQRDFASSDSTLNVQAVPCAEPMKEMDGCFYEESSVPGPLPNQQPPSSPAPQRKRPPSPPAPLASRSMAQALPQEKAKSMLKKPEEFPEEELRRARTVEVDRTALSFRNLRLLGPDSGAGRGQLQGISPHQRLMEQLADQTALFGIDQLFAEMTGGAPLIMCPPVHFIPLERSAGHFATRYEMESPGQVAADGQLHSLTLLRRQGPARRLYRCVPLLDPSVYELALFDNPLQLPLLAGPVQVYKGGDFIVQTPLPTTPPARALTVNLGVEPGLKVARNTHFKESTSGLFGGETILWHRVELELCSNLRRAVRLEIFERVPISNAEEVKVEVLAMPPQAQPYNQTERGDPLRGGWCLTFELGAGVTEKVSLEYQISLPSKQVLVGGNRRD